MSKVLKTFIVLLLLLGIAALVLGTMLFQQREILKGRTQKLENSHLAVAKELRYDKLTLEEMKDYATMDTPLRELAVHGKNTVVELDETKQDLENTRIELAETKDELATTKQELADARNQIDVLEDNLAQKEQELQTALAKIDDLEEQNGQLLAQITDFEAQIAEQKDEITDLNEELTASNEEIDKLYEIIRGPGGTGAVDTPRGLAGTILKVEPEWNFVILDIGRKHQLGINTEMVVHRGEELLGKIRVSTLEDNFAIANIVRDWEQAPLQEGDSVLYDIF